MSDDSDRMERAERIRRMREGSRSDANGQDEPGGETTERVSDGGGAALAEAETDEGPADETADDESADDTAESESTANADERQQTGGATSNGETSSADSHATESPNGTDAATTDDDATMDDEGDGARETTETADTTASESADAAAAKSGFEFEADTDDGDTMSGQTVDTEQQNRTQSSTEETDANASTAETGADDADSTVDTVETAAEPTTTTAEETADDTQAEADDTAEESSAAHAGVEQKAETTTETQTRVLEFSLGEEQYCLDIDYIEEIVKRNTITRVPNTPEYVEGVVDLRGQITTILNPKPVMDIDADGEEELIVVFDAAEFDEGGAIGWLVDDVRQVTPIMDEQVNQPPIDEAYINGVIDRDEDDQFVIWTTPDLALDKATS